MANFGDILSNLALGAGKIAIRNHADNGFAAYPFSRKVQVTDGSAVQFPSVTGAGVGTLGYFIILDNEDGAAAMYMLNAGNVTTYEISDPQSLFSNTKDTASSTNIYNEGSGAFTYYIQNKRGSTRNYQIIMLTDM